MTKYLFEKTKRLLQVMGDEIQNEFFERDTWEILIKRGTFIVALRYSRDSPFIDVVFPSPFKEEESLKRLEDFFNNPRNRMRLLSYLTSPFSSFHLIRKDNRFAGFNVSTRIYPFDEGLSLKILDQAIHSVISAGALGFMYIQTCVGATPVEQKIVHEDVMFQ